jgi:hypothetical protein
VTKNKNKQNKKKLEEQQKRAIGKLTTQEIVEKSMAKSAPEEDWKKYYTVMYQALKGNEYRMLRHGETLFLFKVTPPVANDVHIFSADDGERLTEAFLGFANALIVSGYKEMKGRLPRQNTVLLRLMRRANKMGLIIEETPVYRFEGSTSPDAYDVVIKVGK